MSKWESERRLDFIEDHLFEHGRINRSDVMAMFGISEPQAAIDLQRYAKANPALIYDRNLKTYRWKDGRPAIASRGSTPKRRKVWSLF
jgi:hypothetical protein